MKKELDEKEEALEDYDDQISDNEEHDEAEEIFNQNSLLLKEAQ
jgi:hypothetical protein